MKYLFLVIITCLLLQTIACTKNENHRDNDCTIVTITDSAPGCGGWGIVLNGSKYPSGNIPVEFQQDGMTVCATYELYEDLRLCPCCGGTWANIKSMR